jgi:ketosteroid isomerase-like protein
MNIRKIGALLLATCCLLTSAASAQDPADDQVAVWAVIERQWAAENEGDSGWIEELLTADFVGWPYESPAPRTRASTEMWNEFGRRQRKPITHELYPLSIVVHGDTAIAHYLFTNAGELPDGKAVTNNGRYTDILVREADEWKFLSWHGGEFPAGED